VSVLAEKITQLE
jgi:hypothetical protein